MFSFPLEARTKPDEGLEVSVRRGVLKYRGQSFAVPRSSALTRNRNTGGFSLAGIVIALATGFSAVVGTISGAALYVSSLIIPPVPPPAPIPVTLPAEDLSTTEQLFPLIADTIIPGTTGLPTDQEGTTVITAPPPVADTIVPPTLPMQSDGR